MLPTSLPARCLALAVPAALLIAGCGSQQPAAPPLPAIAATASATAPDAGPAPSAPPPAAAPAAPAASRPPARTGPVATPSREQAATVNVVVADLPGTGWTSSGAAPVSVASNKALSACLGTSAAEDSAVRVNGLVVTNLPTTLSSSTEILPGAGDTDAVLEAYQNKLAGCIVAQLPALLGNPKLPSGIGTAAPVVTAFPPAVLDYGTSGGVRVRIPLTGPATGHALLLDLRLVAGRKLLTGVTLFGVDVTLGDAAQTALLEKVSRRMAAAEGS